MGTFRIVLLLKVVFLQQLPAAGLYKGGISWRLAGLGLVWLGLLCLGSAWLILVALVVVSFGLVWFGLVCLG